MAFEEIRRGRRGAKTPVSLQRISRQLHHDKHTEGDLAPVSGSTPLWVYINIYIGGFYEIYSIMRRGVYFECDGGDIDGENGEIERITI